MYDIAPLVLFLLRGRSRNYLPSPLDRFSLANSENIASWSNLLRRAFSSSSWGFSY